LRWCVSSARSPAASTIQADAVMWPGGQVRSRTSGREPANAAKRAASGASSGQLAA